MERVGTLINKLKEQFEQQADAEKLSVTTSLLLAELRLEQQKNPAKSTSKVSIVMPGYQQPAAITTPESMVMEPSSMDETIAVEPAPAVKEVTEPVPPAPNWLFDTPAEIPTMVHQASAPEKLVFELNEVLVAAHGKEEINELLREEKIEVATVLQGTPVRDLRKAVGINDRYLFVNNLFRGDESMYERSMKTINGFSIYPEAQYWIERELKVKMGWDENCEAVKLFDQLVKRRFS